MGVRGVSPMPARMVHQCITRYARQVNHNHTPKCHPTPTSSILFDRGAIFPDLDGVHSLMPEQAPRKLAAASLPTIALVAIVTALSLPVLIELIASLADLFNSQSTVSFADLFLQSDRIALLARPLAIAAIIGLVSVCMGIPLGRVINAKLTGELQPRYRLFAAILISPIWLPATMVYAAGNLMRAPDTILGHALISYSTSSPDLRWITIWAGYTIAVIGLAIWSAPIAAILIASGMGHRSSLYDEMIALEPVGIIRRTTMWVRLNCSVLLRAWALVAIIMLGSAVPMHLAQLETWSIIIWRQLAQSPVEQWGSVWLSAWPTILIAGFGAWLLTRTVISREEHPRFVDRGHTSPTLPKLIIAAAITVWILGALVPMGAMLVTLNDFDAVLHFWTLQSSAMQDSGIIALITAAITMLIALLIAITLGNPSLRIRRTGAFAVFTLCILGFIPGVLVGAAIARSPSLTGWIGVIFASCIRAGFIGALIGSLCASSESIERKSIRWQMAGNSIRGWCSAVLPGISLPILGSGLVAGLYSMYEIEASIMVRPPGMDNLPQQLLSDLHYARLEQLSAAGINLLLIGLACSIVGTLLISKVRTE